MPKVSIVLPTYNGGKYLRESIDSVISQTFTDWELIIVNDCSTDSSLSIANEYAEKDNRIRVISNEVNKKLPRSLNVGFDNADGDYLTWTSDDNMYLPEAIEKMVNYLDCYSNEYMVCAGINIISENGDFIRSGQAYDNVLMMSGNCVGACFMYKKKVLLDIGGYDPDYFLVEDYEYWLRILTEYGNIGYIDEILYNYRSHGDSLTVTRRKDVLFNDGRLKMAYFDTIVSVLAERKDLLCSIYYRIHFYYSDNKSITDKFVEYIPEIRIDIEPKKDRKTIVYGAGKIGRYYAKYNIDNICFFVDRNEALVGTTIENKEIMPLDKLYDYKDKYNIVIAAGFNNIYSFLCTLIQMGITECSVYRNELHYNSEYQV